MAFRKEINFYFLGSRNYVNGLTIFEEMLKASQDLITQSYGPLKSIHLFKINKFIRSNCSLVILAPHEQPEHTPQEASALMTLRLVNGPDLRLFLLEKEEMVTARLADYDRGRYIGSENADVAGLVSVGLRHIHSEYDLMRAIVEANYRHCVALAAAQGVHQGVSWAYLKDFPWLEKEEASRVRTVNFRNLSVFPTRERLFVIRTFLLDVRPQAEAEMGFFFDILTRQ
jgi:hypothetical protein